MVPIVIFTGLMLLGFMSFAGMKVQDNPDVEFPVIIVSISQPGAAPTEIENQITQRVESAVQGVEGARNISSTASEGNTVTVIEFQIGTDVIEAVNEVKSVVDQIRGELPDGILEPRIFREQTSNNPIGYFAVTANDMTLEQLSWFIDDTVANRLLAIQGMAEVSRGGGVDREIVVTLDPARMQSLGVTASQINQALRQTNLDAGGGVAEIAGSRQSVRVLGNADTAYELSQSRIGIGGGRTIKLSDVADVRDSFGEVRSLGKFEGKQIVTFGVTRAKGESDVSVYDETVAELDRISEEYEGLSFTPLFTSVDYTKAQYSSSIAAMIEGAILAVIVVFFFLRDWRATIIAALAIPLSAIPTFWFMDLMGFTLNTMSLLALSLVAGVLVDDAIVEIENIVRHMRMGKTAYQASIDAADEIGLAVVATSLSIVAVFLPVGLMPGMSGQFFKAFGLTVVAAVLVSLAVARMITPMVAAYFLKSHGHAEHGQGRVMDLYIKLLRFTLDSTKAEAELARPATTLSFFVPALTFGVIAFLGSAFVQFLMPDPDASFIAVFVKAAMVGAIAFVGISVLITVVGFAIGLIRRQNPARMFDGLKTFGHATFARLKDHRFWAFYVGLSALALTVVLLFNLPQQFQPTINQDTSQVNIGMVPGSTIERTDAIADEIVSILREQPEVQHVTQRVSADSGTLYIMLKKDRDTTSIEFEQRLAPALANVADARVSFASQSGGFGSGRDVTIMLAGSDPALLEETAQTVVSQLQDLGTVLAPRVEADLRQPELIIEPRLDLAAELGVTTAALSQTIRIATIGEIDQNAAKFSLDDRQVPIRVVLPKSARRDISTLENLPVPTANGASVPLSRVAEISFGSGPTRIQRYNQSRRVLIGADVAAGQVKAEVLEDVDTLPILQNLPRGVDQRPVGEERWMEELIANFIIAVITGILLVFAVLVLLYHRFVSPLVNMTSLLLAPLGGLLALMLWGLVTEGNPLPMSMPVYIGLLMLLGIVAKNSILLIDFTIEAMAEGMSKREAIIEAAYKRAQPIVMTTVAMAAGMVPTALSLSGDGAWRAPMGVTVIGGLILSTLLTLVIVPAGFSLADGFEKRVGPMLRNTFLTYRPGDEDKPYASPDGDTVPAE